VAGSDGISEGREGNGVIGISRRCVTIVPRRGVNKGPHGFPVGEIRSDSIGSTVSSLYMSIYRVDIYGGRRYARRLHSARFVPAHTRRVYIYIYIYIYTRARIYPAFPLFLFTPGIRRAFAWP